MALDDGDTRCPECHGDDLEVVGFRELRGPSSGEAGPVLARRLDFRCRNCGCDGSILGRVGSGGRGLAGPRITQVPIAGGSGFAPTGAMQFRDDWPGLFVRGDDAIGLMLGVRQLSERLAGNEDVVVALALSRLVAIADIIARDVVVRSTDA